MDNCSIETTLRRACPLEISDAPHRAHLERELLQRIAATSPAGSLPWTASAYIAAASFAAVLLIVIGGAHTGARVHRPDVLGPAYTANNSAQPRQLLASYRLPRFSRMVTSPVKITSTHEGGELACKLLP